MSNKLERVLAMAAWAAALVAAGLWHHEHEALEQSRAQVATSELLPIETLLKENRALIQKLQMERSAENEPVILETYLAKIRRDGVSNNAEMKQRLDALAENNTAIVTLLKAYSPHALTPTFSIEGDKFRNYASAWRDRWNSVMELFMAGGNYPTSGVPFPEGFPAAVEAEIAAAK